MTPSRRRATPWLTFTLAAAVGASGCGDEADPSSDDAGTDLSDAALDGAPDATSDSALDLAEDIATDGGIDADQGTDGVGDVIDAAADATTADGDAEEGPAHWSYDGETGPANWAELDDTYAACGEGLAQSPIDISGVSAARHPGLELEYAPSPLALWNNGHTVEVDYEAGSTLTVDGATYELLQFHFHAQSEHTVGGTHYPLEMHLVHRDERGNRAVVAVFVEEGEENAALAAIWAHIPLEESDEAWEIDGVSVDASDLLPEELAAWRYDGSLTTPPCDEGVRWHVLSTPIAASPEQIGAFTALFDHNYRPAQPLHGRHVEGPHFEYDGELGPDYWAELSPDFEACGAGERQSPIDLGTTAASAEPALALDYRDSSLVLLNNGHTIQANYDPGSTLAVDGQVWEVKQFHFHTESEHTVEGTPYAMEMHIVHQAESGERAVLGVLITAGETDNEALAAIWEHLPGEEREAEVVGGVTINVGDLLPAALSAWRYDGSLTTPPCSEGIRWHVLDTPIQASDTQIAAFAAIIGENARPTQPLGERTID